MKKASKIILIVLLSLLTVLFILFLVLLLNSPGKLEPLTDASGKMIPNAIAEKNEIMIGGIRQGFFIRSENPANPVILYLHGGPGSPELPMVLSKEKAERPEKYFTVCYWDQRGAGMTFSKTTDPKSMTIEQMVEDTREMTEYLQRRFKKNKIFLLGHSWGSYLGIKTIEKYPGNYLAYFGIGQVTYQKESELLAYDYMLQHATETGDKKGLTELKKFNRNAPDFPSLDYIMSVRSELMNKYGIGVTHENVSMVGIVKTILLFDGYTLSEKIKYMQGMLFSLKYAFHYVSDDNLFVTSKTFQVPVYFFGGRYDYQVSSALASKYSDSIAAPEKAFFLFEKSAHSPNMEESDKFVQLIREKASKVPTENNSGSDDKHKLKTKS